MQPNEELPRAQPVTRRQGVYWLCTIPSPHPMFPMDVLPNGVRYVRGQLERGEETGYEHWQLLIILERKGSIRKMQELFGEAAHYELSYSKASEDYVWKEQSRLGEPFELGEKPIRRNDPRDWDAIWDAAREGNLTP